MTMQQRASPCTFVSVGVTKIPPPGPFKDSPQGPPTANRRPPPTTKHQPPPTANRQPFYNTDSVVSCLAHILAMKQTASPCTFVSVGVTNPLLFFSFPPPLFWGQPCASSGVKCRAHSPPGSGGLHAVGSSRPPFVCPVVPQAIRKQCDQRITAANRKLDGIKNDFGEMNIDKMIRSLKEEVRAPARQPRPPNRAGAVPPTGARGVPQACPRRTGGTTAKARRHGPIRGPSDARLRALPFWAAEKFAQNARSPGKSQSIALFGLRGPNMFIYLQAPGLQDLSLPARRSACNHKHDRPWR